MNTAVEFLYERLERMIPRTALYDIDKESYFEQAKAIEKNQIVLAFINGDNSDCLEEENSLLCALAYYNEKFKK